jgi:hypothetical protein
LDYLSEKDVRNETRTFDEPNANTRTL